MLQNDRKIIRELAKQYKELALHDSNHERKQRIRQTNGLVQVRPIVWIDEIPWHEMDIDGALKLHCEDRRFREMEDFFRKALYRWKYIQADMVLEDCFFVKKSYDITDIGLPISERIISSNAENHIVSHQYRDQLDTEEKIEQLKCPVITTHPEIDEQNLTFAAEVLDGILDVKLCGDYIYYAPWDDISRYRGVEPILIDMIERPEFLHKIIAKFTEIKLSQYTQMEEKGLLEANLTALHSTPAYVDELPSADYDGKRARFKDVWFRGMAQMFSTVSPAMHEEFDLQYMKPLMERCGLVYYGCCEPLDDKIQILKKIPNLRKIGVSPWAKVVSSAEQIGKDYVFARKPNPAFVADEFDEEVVRKETKETITACQKYGCPYEMVLKDISTVSYKPQNLIKWNRVVQETLDEFY